MYRYKIGDDVTINGTVVDITEAGNMVVKFKSGGKFLIKSVDINTVHPYQEPPKEDNRKGD